MAEIGKFFMKIQLSNPNNLYLPGEWLRGRIKIYVPPLKSQPRVERLFLEIFGQEHTSFSVEKGKKTESYKGNQTLLDAQVDFSEMLVPFIKDGCLEPGVVEVPFSLHLNENLPPTMFLSRGKI